MTERTEESRLRKPEEFAFELDFANDYLAVRVDWIGGEKIGILVGHDEDQEIIEALLEVDRGNHPDALYHLFEPLDFINKREGWLVGGEDMDG